MSKLNFNSAINSVSSFVKSTIEAVNQFNINQEIYTWHKVVYNSFLLTVIYSNKMDNIFAVYFLILFSLGFGLGLDLLYNAIGKKFGIATLRYRTFHSRTVNGKFFSILVHASIWAGLFDQSLSLPFVIAYAAFALYLAINKIFLEYAKTLKAA